MSRSPIDVVIGGSDADSANPVPVHCVREGDSLPDEAATRTAAVHDFRGQSGRTQPLYGSAGALAAVLFGIGDGRDPAVMRGLPARLPPGDYSLRQLPDGWDPTATATAFALGAYLFDRYKAKPDHGRVRLTAPAGADLDEVRRTAHACALARDMINTPANDMGPLQIETIAREIAERHGAEFDVVAGAELLERNYPAVHAVGRGATDERAPRIVELSWGQAGPRVAVVGKGVVFDTGGLNLKPGAGMRWMKKDMGGAAHALALGRMVMDAKLPVRLTVIIPLVENAVSAESFRPGDVLATRKGLTVEVGNTDAEGRLILADALTRAGELEPELTIDLATLTGAARVALGPQVVPFYTEDDSLADELARAARDVSDPLWRMPLWRGYAEALDSEIAQVSNDGADWAQAGSVVAALFLQKFAPAGGAWVHFDIFAWNARQRPGWPAGAEAQAVRALYAMMKRRYPRGAGA